MKYCPNCGIQCEDDQLFCAKCGTALPVNVEIKTETEAKVVEAEPVVEEAPVVDEAEAVVEAEAEATEAAEEPKAEPIIVAEPIEEEPAPEGKLNVGMLVWSIINIACCCTPFGVISLIMTIIAKNSAPDDAKKKIKTATILNTIGTVLGFLYFILMFVIGFIGALEG